MKANHTEVRPLAERFRDANGTLGEVFVTAHRGVFLDGSRPTSPENSVPAVFNAMSLGVDMVEIDVHLTDDGTIVVIHDDTLDRTTAHTGKVSQLRRKDLAEIDLVHPTSKKPYGATLPSLEDIFAEIDSTIMVNVELKSGIEMLPHVAEVAANCGVSNQITIKSNLDDATEFKRVRNLIDNCPHPVDLIPVIVDSRDGYEGFSEACRTLSPSCVECIVDYDFGSDDGYNLLERRGMTLDGGVLFSRRSRRLAFDLNVRLFVNTLFVNPKIPGDHQWNGGRSCEMGRVVPDSVYGFWIAHGATVIQTDDSPFVLAWLRKAGFRA